MDSAGVSTALTASIAATGSTGNQQTISVLKKANEINETLGQALIEALPEPAKVSTDRLGNVVNEYA